MDSMSPDQARTLGLTTDPTETGVLHDAYARAAGGPYYLTRAELRAVERRARHRHHAPATEDLDALRATSRTQRVVRRRMRA